MRGNRNEQKVRASKIHDFFGKAGRTAICTRNIAQESGPRNPVQLETAVNEVYEYYTTIMNDLLFEARAENNDPANGYSVDTEWLSKMLKGVQLGMEDYE